MEKHKLKEVLQDQQILFDKIDNLVEREVSLNDCMKGNEIIIITGIRRCGKSSLLKIISKKLNKKFIYINFDDIRFTDFKVENFEDIEEIISEIRGIKTEVIYLLDEVQNVLSWERWVNNLYAKFKKIKIDCQTTDERRIISQAFNEYFEKGGFPLVIINDDLSLSKQYFEDILNKDIIKRYGIKKVKELKDLILYLFSNVSKTYSYSTLKQISSIKSLSMINNYIEHLKNVFVASTINKFDYSIKKQRVSSSKFYVLDNSFLKTVAFNFSENMGKRLENLVFIELVRREVEVYYYLKKNECDFIIKEGLNITKAIQVCLILDNIATKNREIDGLIEAMKEYNLKEGLILTLDKEEEFMIDGKKIIIKPVWKWLLEKS